MKMKVMERKQKKAPDNEVRRLLGSGSNPISIGAITQGNRLTCKTGVGFFASAHINKSIFS
jgi:hypothetical protein